jgi:hypothetical protein
MLITDAIEFSKNFPRYHPKIFKGFFEWSIRGTETNGYIVLTDVTLADEQCSNQLEDYVKSHNLKVERIKDYLMICTIC